jgi:hypothetical protein
MIIEVIDSLRARQRRLNVLRFAAHGLMAGAAAGVLAAGIAWMAQAAWVFEQPLLATLAIPLFAVIGVIIGWLVPINDLRLARALDRAAAGEDRFASAVQLTGHHRHERARLVADDALSRVRGTTVNAALPWQMPRSLRWMPLPVLSLLVIAWLAPSPFLEAAAPLEPEISAEEWTGLREELASELETLPKAETQQEQELRHELEDLASLLDRNPEKKDVLKEIARLTEQVERQRAAMDTRDVSMKTAASAIARSEALKQFASMLKQGEYSKAAAELAQMAEQLKEGSMSPTATEFEAIAEDMERLSRELSSHEEMHQACQKCANAANSMNRQSLSEAMKRLSEQLRQNSDKLKQCDSCSRCSSMLDQLKRRMNQCSQCSGCKNGCSSCRGGNKLVQGQGKKGGLKAGWGSAAKWEGGAIAKGDEQRTPDVADAQERAGESSSYTMVSPDERAKSGLGYEELYAEFVQKTEADLELEAVPLAYREYLRRYFNAIRPQEAPAAASPPSAPE